VAETVKPPEMRWWGWGDEAHPPGLREHALAFLREHVGIAARPRPPVALGAVALPVSGLDASTVPELERVVGAENVRTDHRERVLHAAGKGYADLVRLRSGAPDGAPDAVVHPANHDQVQAVLGVCAAASVAVVPFGGGTSVVGGVAPMRGEHAAVLALDLGRLGSVLALDRESSTVTVGAGMRGPALERHLSDLGLTLGHFPQSFEYVSLGGCAATRSAGQSSTGYGSIEKMVLGMRLAAPAGEIALAPLPASAAGPGLRQLLVGSEGTLGVISEVSLRVREAPAEKVYEGVFFEDFASGSAVMRELAREHVLPDVARLSDEAETRMSLALAGSGGVKGLLGRAYLGLRGYRGGCLAIFGFEGEQAEVAFRRKRALELARRGGGLAVGGSPGAAWLKGRFAAPYLRDDLLTHGVMVETLETATQWSKLAGLHRGVSAAIDGALHAAGTPGLVMCHVSHVYETGASLYFTFLARQSEGAEIEQWQAVKRAASDAIIAGGGTITHHHAVGLDHAPWMGAEIGELGLESLRAVKARLDPNGIMNPGKLLAG
jgi:alkyldihydroxyacetonephosphate synthase